MRRKSGRRKLSKYQFWTIGGKRKQVILSQHCVWDMEIILVYRNTVPVSQFLVITVSFTFHYDDVTHVFKINNYMWKKISIQLVDILRENSNEAEAHELGRIVIKLPLPPGCVSTLYHNDKKFKEIYFSKYPVSFFFYF